VYLNTVKSLRLVSLLSFAVVTALAFAKDEFDTKVANIEVLRDKAVQSELKITPGQLAELNRFADSYSKANKTKIEEYQKAKKQPDAAFQSYAMSQYVTLRTAVLKILSDGQLKRLREITIQAAGPRAILDKVIATKVGLSDGDYDKVKTAILEGDQKTQKIRAEVGKKIQAKYKTQKQPKTKAEADALNKKLDADLNAEMKKRAGEMQKIIAASDAKVKLYVKQTHLDKLKALMGSPFTPKAAAAPPKK
jgi:hypothetical protein